MRQKLSLILTLVAWLFATGSQWDVVQAFAWVRMLAANAQELPFAAAVERTFSPEGRCELCVAVAEARQEQEDPKGAPAPEKFSDKVLLAFQSAPDVWVEVTHAAPWLSGIVTVRSTGRAAPPLPPPRVLVA